MINRLSVFNNLPWSRTNDLGFIPALIFAIRTDSFHNVNVIVTYYIFFIFFS